VTRPGIEGSRRFARRDWNPALIALSRPTRQCATLPETARFSYLWSKTLGLPFQLSLVMGLAPQAIWSGRITIQCRLALQDAQPAALVTGRSNKTLHGSPDQSHRLARTGGGHHQRF